MDAQITPGRWQQVQEIFNDALECVPDQRPALLERACAGDVDLRERVDALLLTYESTETQSLAGLSTITGVIAGDKPRHIGPYRLERELGSGGMGQVWLAEQTDPVRRRVAVKVIRAGFYHEDVLKRFLSERQSLALMSHPAIAKIFEAGATVDGQPYLAMEYVDGLPITEYCDRHSLTIVERLRLVQLVCEGVQHAHQKAIIHRDLKPSNILVKQVDGKAVPQIIDFGVAKELTPTIEVGAFMTQIGTLVGTPGYMSPEQARPNTEDVDTRTDVYTLGVILYELLVGALPHDPSKQHAIESLHRAFDEAARKPSTKIRQRLSDADQVAISRRTQVPMLLRQLRGDLDSIALKALEHDRNRRYASPAELAADISRYLVNQPVLARAPSVAYRTGKYLRRNWAGVAAISAAVVLLMTFAVTQSIQLRKIRLERDRADQILGFMKQIFKVADPSEVRGNTVTAREMLDRSAQQIESGQGLDAQVQTDLLEVTAETYKNLGLYGRAHDLAERAYDRRRELLGAGNTATLDAMNSFGNILFLEGQTLEAESLLRRTLALQLRTAGPADVHTLETKNALVDILLSQGSYKEAERTSRELIDTESATFGSEHPLTLRSMANLASALRHQSRFAEAEKLLRQTLSIQTRARGADDPDTMTLQISLASLLEENGHYSQAEAIYRDVLTAQRRVLGVDHPVTASTMTHLAIDLYHDGARRAETEQLFRDALAVELRQVGPESRLTTRTEEGLANLLVADSSRQSEAEQLFREVLRVRQKVLGPDNTDTLLTQYNVANLMFERGRFHDAEEMFRVTWEQQKRVLGAEHPDVLASEYMVANSLLHQNHAREAVALAKAAFEAQLRILGPQHMDTRNSLDVVAHALVSLGRYDEAKVLYAHTVSRIADVPESDAASAYYAFADFSAHSGHVDDALNSLERAVQAGYADRRHVSDDPEFKDLRQDPRFAGLLQRIGQSAP